MKKDEKPTSFTQLKPGVGFRPPPLAPPPPILNAAGQEYDVTQTGLAGRVRTDHHGKELAPRFQHELVFEMIKEFDWKERFMVLLGCNAIIKGSVLCVHNPGVTAPACVLTIQDKKLRKRSLDEINEEVKDRLRQVFGRAKKLIKIKEPS